MPRERKLSLLNLKGTSFRLKVLEPLRSGYQKPDKDGAMSKIVIAEGSDRLQSLTPFSEWNGNDFAGLPLLIKAKGKCTTDHISMAGLWLKYRGHLENISNNYMIGAVN